MLFIVFTVEIELRRRDSVGLRSIVHLPRYLINSIAQIGYPLKPDSPDRRRKRAVWVSHYLHVGLNVALYHRKLRLGVCKLSGAVIGHAFEGEQFFSACRFIPDVYKVCSNFMRTAMKHVIPVCKSQGSLEATDLKGEHLQPRRQCSGDYKPPRRLLALAPSSLRSGQPRRSQQGSHGANCGDPVSPFGRIETRVQASGDQGAGESQGKQWVPDNPRFEMIDCNCHKEILA